MVKAGSFVRVHQVILKSNQRTSSIPEDTANTDLRMWTKGFLNSDAEIGDEVEITTLSGRIEHGELVAVNHMHEVNYGDFVEEIIPIGVYLKEKLHG
ncbi:MAG: 2-amino-4-oxopentanoate thiolase subunit OrtA [Bacilli bacterium]